MQSDSPDELKRKFLESMHRASIVTEECRRKGKENNETDGK